MKLSLLLKELDKLNLPKDQYVITSSAVLAAHGLREPKDIDIVVSKELWEKFSSEYTVTEEPFKSIKLNDYVEVLGEGSYFVEPSIMSPEDQLNDHEVINDYPYVRLETLKEFKKFGGREKDLEDVKIIEEYLSNL